MKILFVVSITLIYFNSSIARDSHTTLQACTVHGAIYQIIPFDSVCQFFTETEGPNIQGDSPIPADSNPNPFVVPPTNLHRVFEPHNPECFGSNPVN